MRNWLKRPKMSSMSTVGWWSRRNSISHQRLLLTGTLPYIPGWPRRWMTGYISSRESAGSENRIRYEKCWIIPTENRCWTFILFWKFSKVEVRNTIIYVIWMLILKKWFDRISLNFRILELLARSERFMNFKKIDSLSFVKYLFNIFVISHLCFFKWNFKIMIFHFRFSIWIIQYMWNLNRFSDPQAHLAWI